MGKRAVWLAIGTLFTVTVLLVVASFCFSPQALGSAAVTFTVGTVLLLSQPQTEKWLRKNLALRDGESRGS